MPLVLQQGTSAQDRAAPGGIVDRAMRDALGVPPDARSQIISEHVRDGFRFDPQDVFINLVEVAKENWSFGNGQAQYAT